MNLEKIFSGVSKKKKKKKLKAMKDKEGNHLQPDKNH